MRNPATQFERPQSFAGRFGHQVLIIALALLFLPSLFGSNAQAENWAEKMFPVQSHNFRVVGRGAKSEYRFQFTNPYEQDVHIASVRTSCGCTTPTVSERTVGTHQTGEIVAELNTDSFIGQKAATVTVIFDRPSYAEVKLNVSGYIRTDISFDPPELNFGEFRSGETPEQEVTITHVGNPNWEITDVRSECRELKVRLLSVERNARQVNYRMSVRIDGPLSDGELRERITLISNDASFPTTEMLLFGRVAPLVSISPAAISLGDLGANANKEQRLVVRSDQDFEIRNVLCEDPRIEFEVGSGRKKIHFVKLRFRGDGSGDSIAQEIQVITDLEENGTAACLVTGRIR
ncbi:MAG: DUF1573 domain-containing protein [Rubripirellula sp.]|nr:DUF1573 domain-containing protein [Rubripirellula sp.]